MERRQRWSVLARVAFAAVLVSGSLQAGEAKPAAPILDFKIAEDGVEVTVPTGGCTEKSHFRLRPVEGAGETILFFDRMIRDRCKGNFPEGTRLEFSWKEIGIAPHRPVTLGNPIARK